MAKTSVYRWVEFAASWNSGHNHWEWKYICLPEDESTHVNIIDDMTDSMVLNDISFHNHGFRDLTWKFKTPPDDYIQNELTDNIQHCRALLKRNRIMRETLSTQGENDE